MKPDVINCQYNFLTLKTWPAPAGLAGQSNIGFLHCLRQAVLLFHPEYASHRGRFMQAPTSLISTTLVGEYVQKVVRK